MTAPAAPGTPRYAWLALILLGAAVLGGGCGLSTTPYDARLACESVGARYTADGRCQAGSP